MLNPLALDGDFGPDPLAELARAYHEQCEAFDRRVCSATRNGIAMPVNGHESALINKNALETRKRLFEQAERMGFSWGEWQRAIVRHAP